MSNNNSSEPKNYQIIEPGIVPYRGPRHQESLNDLGGTVGGLVTAVIIGVVGLIVNNMGLSVRASLGDYEAKVKKAPLKSPKIRIRKKKSKKMESN